MRHTILLLLTFCCSIFLSAQQFGGFPPRTQWKQIDTDTARIIFTPDATEQAQRIATLIHKIATGTPDTIGTQLRKINIVLHSHTTLANGYVGLAPFRSEYYLIPSGDIFEFGTTPWEEQLAVHEYRHVQQYSNFNHGLSKALTYILGEQGQALGNALTVPDWFFEGDAVHAETALTLQGRGRLPFFLNAYNSLWQDKKQYSWMKLRNGSLKDYVPNHYYVGYLLVNYGYLKYGPDFWEKVTRDASAFKGVIYPFQVAVKRYAGIDYKTFRDNALNYYQQQLPKQLFQPIILKNKTVTNIYFPQPTGKDSVLYLKTTYRQLPKFIIKKGRRESVIKLKNIGPENWFSYRNGIIAYTAYRTDARWSLTDYGDIVLLDIKTKKEKWLTHKGKYFTPSFSPDGRQLICVSMNDSLQTELQLLNVADGHIITRIKATNNDFFSNPAFANEHTIVYGVRLANSLMTLQRMHVTTHQTEQLIPPTPNTLGFPQVHNDTVYFTATFDGNDDLYALSLRDKKTYQLTQGVTGNYYPHVSNDTMYWSHFTSNGYQLKTAWVYSLLWKEIHPEQLAEQINRYKVADAVSNVLQTPARDFPVTKYAQSHGLLHFHSWQPYYTAPNYSLNFLSDNILNTLSSELYYQYNQNEASHAFGFNAAYAGWFPVLTAGASYTLNRHIYTPTRQLLLNQYEIKGGYYIPLDFTKGKTYKNLSFGTQYVFNVLLPAAASKNNFTKINTSYLSHYISWGEQLPLAVQHIYPKLGYAVYANYKNRLNQFGYQFLGNGVVYLPSVFRNHSIVLSGSFQQTDTGNVVFDNNFVNSRGYADYYYSKMWRASANYHFPLFYPDWGFGNIVYFLRVRGNIFYDYTRVYSKNKTVSRDLRSTGAEVFFDTRWWNELPVSFGIRYSYLLDRQLNGAANRNVFEIVLPVNLIPNTVVSGKR